MFLPYEEIVKKGTWGELIATHFKESLTKQASYDLRLGDEVYLVGSRSPEKLSDSRPYITLPPGQFAILTSYEEVKIPPDVLAFITLKMTFKIEGLVNVSGFHVDPTFEGKLLFVVQNVGPDDLRLKYKEPTFTIFFSKLAAGATGPPRDQDTEARFKGKLTGIRLEHVQVLGGSSLTLAKLQKDIDRVRVLVLIYGPFVVAAFIALIVDLLQHAKP